MANDTCILWQSRNEGEPSWGVRCTSVDGEGYLVTLEFKPEHGTIAARAESPERAVIALLTEVTRGLISAVEILVTHASHEEDVTDAPTQEA